MRILYLSWGDYPKFLKWLYGSNPALARASYDEQLAARAGSLFGTMDAYSRNFMALGHQAAEVFVNNTPLQAAWAREHGLPGPGAGDGGVRENDSGLVHGLKTMLRPWRNSLRPLAGRLGLVPRLDDFLTATLRAQIEDFAPDLVICDNIEMISGRLIRESAPRHCFIIGQHGLDLPQGIDLSSYDLMVSILDWVVAKFHDAGIPAHRVDGAFETSILEKLPSQQPKDIEISFVGGLGPDHGDRLRLLEEIARHAPLQMWGPPLARLSSASPLHACYRGEAWGTEMYNIHRRSKIALNSHIGAARGEPVNMRLYEATGVGAFLLSDNVLNPKTFDRFTPGRHLAGYSSVQDCLDQVLYYLAHSDERETIAAAGQAHTLSRHTYRDRVEELLQLAVRHAR